MIDFSKVNGMTIPEGVVRKITDASGRVLWSATIKFTMNGVTYEADRGMTWAEWFASDYNTTGETEGDIKDADGNAVSLDAVIVGGTVYEVGFGITVPEGMYLTFSSAESFTLEQYFGLPLHGGSLYYSTDATKWNEWDGYSPITSATHNGKQRLYLCGIGNNKLGNKTTNNRWIITGNNVECNGNIECLLDYEKVAAGEHPAMADSCFAYLFYNCTALSSAPDLPATTLPAECYLNMFFGCTGLTKAPSLPATTLSSFGVYGSMFKNCSNLTTLPRIHATELTARCCRWMFSGCTKIKLSQTKTDEYQTAYRIPTSGTGVVANTSALEGMFDDTGGTFAGTPTVNTTYYTSNEVV